MNVIEIPFNAQPQVVSLRLAGQTYTWRLYWLDPAQCWMIDIADIAGNPLISGVALVTGGDLLGQLQYLVPGWLFVISDQKPVDTVPGWGDLGVTGHLYFVPP